MNRSIPSHERSLIEETILRAVGIGYNLRESAKIGGIHRATLYRWLEAEDRFATRFATAWERGTKRREFRAWLAHPFRGFRPPLGKQTRSFPRYMRRRK